jgi:hypothetical protein
LIFTVSSGFIVCCLKGSFPLVFLLSFIYPLLSCILFFDCCLYSYVDFWKRSCSWIYFLIYFLHPPTAFLICKKPQQHRERSIAGKYLKGLLKIRVSMNEMLSTLKKRKKKKRDPDGLSF